MVCSDERWGPIFLKVINVIFIIFSLALIIPGVMILANVDLINDNILPLMKQLTYGGFNLGDVATSLSVTLIVVGAIVLIIASLGAIGAFCNRPACLDIYAGIVLILFVGKLFAVFLWFDMNAKLQSFIKTQLLTVLQSNYAADDLSSNQISTAFNYLFMSMSCCAVNALNGTINDFDQTPWITGGTAGSKEIPTFCCQGVTPESFSTYNDTTCTVDVTANYYTTGCYDAVYNVLNSYSIAFIVIGITILVIEALAVVTATNYMHYKTKLEQKKRRKKIKEMKKEKA
ncbi:tetraspanin-9-like isoform X2 [Saccostrea echinata]|uniref:tetraspanin-9-like isoform X2 n=1 Tax=Saccostrea echinata TaxID=191078 RepID=UPI002A838ACD|nr:tetraspanin-9-like isoform X2 [Saccostrea echinata]